MIVKRQNEYSLQFIVAVLNSKLLNTYQIANCKIKRAGYLEYVGEVISNFPIRRITFTTPTNERSKLFEKGKRLYNRCLSNGDNDCVLGFVEYQFTQTPERADVVHDLLGFLAEEMIAMNKEKQAEAEGFLAWLERHIGAKVADLSNRAKIRVYHNGDFNALLDVLRQNSRRLKVNPDTRTIQERMKNEFYQSMAKLTPLNARLSATDRLINLIVYRLYGLTEREITIVEGRANPGTETIGTVG